MRKFIKFVIILGAVLVLAGGAIVGYAAYKGQFGQVSYETKEYVADKEFKSLKINVETIDVKFVKAEDDKCKITYDEEKGYSHTFDIKNDTLEVIETCNLKWYEKMFRWTMVCPKMEVALPENVYENVSLTLATGELDIENFEFKNIEIKSSTGDVSLVSVNVTEKIDINVSTGEVELSNVTSNVCTINSSTGDVKLNRTVIQDALKIKASTGGVRFTESDALTIDVKTSTGDINGSILSPKSFQAKSSTGDVNVPNTTGESCTLSTSTGDIYITIVE